MSTITLRAYTVALTFAASVFTHATLGADAWQSFSGLDKSFNAEMPAAPTASIWETKSRSGSPYMMHRYRYENENGAYLIQTAVYPADVDVSNPKSNLQIGIENSAKNMVDGKWKSIDWVTHQGLAAVDATANLTSSGQAIRTFSVINGRQILTLTYVGPPGTAQSADANRFIKSLLIAR